MNTLVIIALSFVGYIAAYRLYGNYLSNKIFKIRKENKVPSVLYQDGIDFIPSKKSVLFGHHFTTIAGLGPVVGPAIGIIWGWLPALLWVFLGSIFMGAVHDFSTLVISTRAKGETIGDLTGNLVGKRARLVFQLIIQFLLFMVLAIFAMIVGLLFKMYPEAVIPVWFQIPLALLLGKAIRAGKSVNIYAILALILMYASILLGVRFPIHIIPVFGSEVVSWSILLYVYVFIASTLPVNVLLQPRDYINANQLFIAMGLLLVSLIVVHPTIQAPAIAEKAPGSDLPNMFPLLFITIACGAISGFHSLAASGTTVKQLEKETDAQFIAYGSMLWESFLAVIVLMTIAGGLGLGLETDHGTVKGSAAFREHYSSWKAAAGLDAKLGAFITGGSNLLASLGIPKNTGQSMIAVFIVSFANTTLDSSARIQRLSLQELIKGDRGKIAKPFNNRYVTTFVIIVIASVLTFAKGNASGAMVLWPLFGALNQLLAALGLGVVTVWLRSRNKNMWLAFIPMLIILTFTVWAMIINTVDFYRSSDWLLFGISSIISVLTLWLLMEGALSVRNSSGKTAA